MAALFRRQLSAIEEELAEGRMSAPERRGGARRDHPPSVAAAEQRGAGAEAAFTDGGDYRWRIASAIGIAGLFPAAAVAVYLAVGAPSAIERKPGTGAAQRRRTGHCRRSVCKAHLQQAPDDLKGWTLLGRTLASLGRLPRRRTPTIQRDRAGARRRGPHAEFGESWCSRRKGWSQRTPRRNSPKRPRIRARAITARRRRCNTAIGAARQQLEALLAEAPADAPWRQAVADRLAELSPKAGGPPSAAAPAGRPRPTAQDVAAAQSMTPEQRQAMIRGMVERLAQRLEQHPDDKAGMGAPRPRLRRARSSPTRRKPRARARRGRGGGGRFAGDREYPACPDDAA